MLQLQCPVELVFQCSQVGAQQICHADRRERGVGQAVSVWFQLTCLWALRHALRYIESRYVCNNILNNMNSPRPGDTYIFDWTRLPLVKVESHYLNQCRSIAKRNIRNRLRLSSISKYIRLYLTECLRKCCLNVFNHFGQTQFRWWIDIYTYIQEIRN